MKKIKLGLFIIGGLSLVTGFLLSKTDDVPWILNLLSPDYMEAREGVEKLENLESLEPGHKGFTQISNIWLDLLKTEYSPELVEKHTVERIRYEDSQGSYATKLGILSRLPVMFDMSNGQELTWDLDPLRKEVEKLKKHDFTRWANWLFSLGLLLYIVNFWITKMEERRKVS